MTTICAIATPEGVYFGSDSFVSCNGLKMDGGPKWQLISDNPQRLIGSAGAGLIGAAIEANLDRLRTASSPYHLCRVVSAILRDEGIDAPKDNDGIPNYPGQMIVIWDGAVFHADSSFIPTPVTGFFAVGTGFKYAMGAFNALSRIKALGVADRIFESITTAAMHDPGTGGEIHVRFAPKSGKSKEE